MKAFILFLIVTGAFIYTISSYFEYCVSRPFNEALQYLFAVVALILTFFYFKYLVKQTLKLLKIKS